MTEYHTVYKGPEGESTQWDDIQAKLGNRPAKVGNRTEWAALLLRDGGFEAAAVAEAGSKPA